VCLFLRGWCGDVASIHRPRVQTAGATESCVVPLLECVLPSGRISDSSQITSTLCRTVRIRKCNRRSISVVSVLESQRPTAAPPHTRAKKLGDIIRRGAEAQRISPSAEQAERRLRGRRSLYSQHNAHSPCNPRIRGVTPSTVGLPWTPGAFRHTRHWRKLRRARGRAACALNGGVVFASARLGLAEAAHDLIPSCQAN
jgi:hypothetical protein